MKKLLTFLSIGILISCSQGNERIDKLEKRVDDIESISMAAIKGQIESAVNEAIDTIESSFRSWADDQLKNYYTLLTVFCPSMSS